MAFRVARGFFRLWIIFSVLWIGGVAVNAWSTLPVDQEVNPQPTGMFDDLIPPAANKPDDSFDPDKFLAYQACKDAGNNDDQCTAIMKAPNKYLAYQRCMHHGHDDQCAAILEAPPFDPSKPYVIIRGSERRTAVRFAVLLALVPPSFLLAFGSALVWAIRGFRADTGTPS
jgi:hypothetical protein